MIQNEFLTEKPSILFDKFLNDYGNIFDIDNDEAKRMLRDDSLFQRLTFDWYEKLDQNNLDDAFKVYDDDYYFVDIFNCYRTYSRNYIKRLLKPTMANGESVYDLLKNSTGVLMLFTPEDIQIDDIVKDIQEIDVIKNMHHVHVWQLNENEIHLEAHIDFTEDITLSKFNKILYQIEKKLYHIYRINHINIQPEYGKCDKKTVIVQD